MCGIFACHCHPDVKQFKPTALRMAKALRHRGPDWSGNFVANNTILAHERLSIVGVDSGAQPLVNDDETLALAVNERPEGTLHFKTHSDCEVSSIYMEHGVDAPKYLDGMFSWVLFDKKENRVVAARDPIGHVYDSKTDTMTRYFQPKWWDPTNVPSAPVDYKLIREGLEKAVRKRLMAEVPYGVLLSGGLDSSLVASIAQRETLRMQAARKELLQNGAANGTSPNGTDSGLVGIDDTNEISTVSTLPQLNSFSIGLPNAPDTKAAIEVAEFLGTKHHALTFTIEDGLNALSDVIYHLESYDVTAIRASTPIYGTA
ncbi:asparagine synthetase [Trichophyton equinum CBS 127.97]|uniref:Asparagine synthetase n=1 Tax=Trichophyton equinum (strain ATCC MYA-4606 / CBS 127.97) TaxID=559882 RepID=F2Q1V8_TRIEC|nr:asparagine synthetase [Trichophyton equinum CBS 127.97]